MDTLLKIVRRVAGILRTMLYNGATFSARVEGKADRIVRGVDAFGLHNKQVPLERVLIEGVPEIAPLYPSLPAVRRGGTVTLLLPSLQNSAFYGGAATALIVAARLAALRGVGLRVVETVQQGGATVAEVQAFLRSKDIGWAGPVDLLDVSRRRFGDGGDIDVHPDDVFVASAWWDAHVLDRLPLPRRYVYLVQDFEPCFYGNGDKYAMAEATYHSDRYVALCNTRIMHEHMSALGYGTIAEGTFFEPAVGVRPELAGRPADGAEGGRRRMFLYARPTVTRNLFHTGLAAIDACFADGRLDPAGWEVVMAGEGGLPDVELAGGVIATNLGKLDPEAYDRLLRTVDLAVTPMMAPHPNYPTLEFASAGAQVVTTAYETKQDLSVYADTIVLSGTTPGSMADAIATAAARIGQPTTSHVGTSWTDALDTPLTRTLETLGFA